MGQLTISVTKAVSFRDSVQEFSNVYTYGSIDNANREAAIACSDEVVAYERTIHAQVVQFRRLRVWSSGGTIAQNVMLYQENLSGTGAQGNEGGIDRERAYLVMWPAGKDRRGKPVFLRKWYHLCTSWPGTSLTTAMRENVQSLAASDRETIAASADTITRVAPFEGWGLIADSGRERDGGNPIAHRYFEHHQMGDQWRK